MTERSPRASGLGRLCTTVVRTTRTSSMSGQHSHSPHESGRSQRLACGARWHSRQYRRGLLGLAGPQARDLKAGKYGTTARRQAGKLRNPAGTGSLLRVPRTHISLDLGAGSTRHRPWGCSACR